ncbi:MAG: ABC transporter permease, partial [Gemmatimonadota bacterium]|nr:ABC transporter permease [Gemmatimonadota bacterium]
FLSVMGIEVLSGQGFDPNLPHGVLLNETAARFFDPEDLIGRTLTLSWENGQPIGEPMTVIGIVKDFHFVDMRHTIGPAFLTTFMPGLQRDRFSNTLFRLDRADLPAAVEEVKALWKRVFPQYELWRACASSTSPLPRDTRPSGASALSWGG